jgi:hypothetical protein
MKIHKKPDDLPCGTLYDGWNLVDYNLQTTIPGCFYWRIKLSDHGANRLELQL